MDSRKMVLQETKIIVIGVGICLAVMFGVYALLGRLSSKVLLGGAVGAVLAVLNFFFMAVNACTAADKAVDQDVKGGRALMKFSYTTRLVVMFVVLFAGVKSGLCDVLASMLPLLFVRPVITVAEFFRKK